MPARGGSGGLPSMLLWRAFLLLLGFFGLLFFLFHEPVWALLETIFQYVAGLAVLIPLIILLMTGMPS